MDQDSKTVSAPVSKARKMGVIRWALIVGIVVVFNLFVNYATRTVYHEPKLDEFCPESQVRGDIVTKDACLSAGGQWTESPSMVTPEGGAEPRVAVPEKVTQSYCDEQFTCRKRFEEALKVYNRNVFVVFVVAGVFALAGSVFLSGSAAVSFGLAFGGTLAFIIGSITYWSDMNDWLRVIILGGALAVLIWLGYKRFSDED